MSKRAAILVSLSLAATLSPAATHRAAGAGAPILNSSATGARNGSLSKDVHAGNRLDPPQFTEVGAVSGTDDSGYGYGVAWGDYDNDGDLDLYLANDAGTNRLFQNNGDGTFTDVGVTSGTGDNGNGRAAAWGDYDNDGDLDLYLSNDGTNRLYQNNGDGTFGEVGAVSGTDDNGYHHGVGWADYDNDGALDLYLANWGGAQRLYQNNGDGTFAEVGAVSGTGGLGAGTGVAWGDYDNDGDLDLYLAIDGGPFNRLYRNNSDGTFTDVGVASGTGDNAYSHGVAWGDYDNDLDLDLYVANGTGTPSRLYQNNGDGTFTDVGAASGTVDNGNGYGVTWGDYDNDADLDLYLVNHGGANRLYQNNGDGTFSDVGAMSGTDDGGSGLGAAWGDYDNDGDLDLYVANYGSENRLYRNDGAVPPGSHWLHVDLVGTVSNRSGIGARIRCVTSGTNQIREISGGSGWFSQNSLTAEFGLGTATTVDSLEVRWPSGIVQTLVNQSVDQRITVSESASPPTQFTEVGAVSATDDSGYGFGVAWGDYDNDGDLDLYLSNQYSGNRLYQNDGSGAFTEVGAASGTDDGGLGHGVAWGDYDNDSDLDLYLANAGPNRLYRNNGDGTFAEVGVASGTDDGAMGQGNGAAWGDYDNDGDLDLYLANSGGANRLYRNNGDGTFAEVGSASGTADGGDGQGVAWGDYDNDGDLDLYLANFGTNRLYQNNGNGTFAEVGAASGTNSSGGNTGVAWGDYDNDGDLDLYVAKFASANLLYRNNGNGTFLEVGAATGTNDTGNGNGVAWGDYDNDGDLDLYLANQNSANRLYQNNGDGTFAEVGVTAGTADTGESRGAAFGDYDNDGDLDLYVANNGANRLYRNDTAVPSGHHWLHVVLIGTVSNKSGIGARVRCVTGAISQIREISGGSGYFSQNSLTAEFGLGTTTVVDTVEVQWPSGLVQTLVNQTIDQQITVTEITGEFTEVGAASGTDNYGAGTDAVWGDYDNDGDLDLYVADDLGINRLYQNNGNGTFDEVGAASGADGGLGRAAAWGDYDNDGDLDLYLAVRDGTNRLYRSQGNGTFTEVGAASGTDNTGIAQGVGWADYDNDGDLDLYVVDEGGGANRLYRNEDNGTFTEVGVASGTNNVGDGRGVAWADYDNDGDVDFYVSKNGTSLLYRNNGDGTFTEVGVASGTNSSGENTGAAWGDYDNDGDLDLYVAKFAGANQLYRNNGNGTFLEVGAASGTNDTGSSISVAWGDFDNDGDLDLYVANDGPNRLYRNEGSGTFTEIGAATGVDAGGIGAGVAWGDYDNDGDLDLYLANFNSSNRLYRNNHTGNHWLHVSLVGTVSNRTGIGARVRCVSGGTSQIREICGGSGRFSQSSLTAEFGLGTTAVLDTLEVRWPSGIVQKIVGPGVDQRITVTETGPTAVPDEPVLPKKYALYANMPNPFNPATTIRFDLPGDAAVDLHVYDVSGRMVRALVNGLHYPAGRHQVAWDGRNEHGNTVASGVYFYRIRTNEFIATRRMVLLK